MNKQEEILTILQEECAEVSQAVSKVRRFGMEKNVTELKKEIADVLCMIDILLASDIVSYDEKELDTMKRDKVLKLRRFSRIFQSNR